MGHKVHPNGFRLGVSRTWNAKWYADRDYTDLLREDMKIRKLVTLRLANASVSLVEIERGINMSPSRCIQPSPASSSARAEPTWRHSASRSAS